MNELMYDVWIDEKLNAPLIVPHGFELDYPDHSRIGENLSQAEALEMTRYQMPGRQMDMF